jgi:hypothetical protein
MVIAAVVMGLVLTVAGLDVAWWVGSRVFCASSPSLSFHALNDCLCRSPR